MRDPIMLRHLAAVPLALCYFSDVSAPTPPAAKYEFTDSSVSRPALTRWWFARLFPLVPRRLAANLVSLLSSGVLLGLLALSLAPNRPSDTAFALIFFVALQLYVAGDHLDGMQAVASGTASPLGDFIDHYCDLWAGAMLIFAFWMLTGATSAPLLYAMVSLLILAFATTYAEREAERKLHFVRWGALEANLVLGAFLLSWAVPPVRAWWRSPSVAGVPWYAFGIGVVAAMGAGTIVVIVRRMRRVPAPLFVASAATIVLAVLLSGRPEIAPAEGWLLLGLFGGRYVALVMHGYLVPGHRAWPDPVAVVAVFAIAAWNAAAGIPPAVVRPAAAAFGVYLAVTLAIALARIVAGLRRHWVWVNPVAADARRASAAAGATAGAGRASGPRSMPPRPSHPTPRAEADPSAGPSRTAS